MWDDTVDDYQIVLDEGADVIKAAVFYSCQRDGRYLTTMLIAYRMTKWITNGSAVPQNGTITLVPQYPDL
jgi:hypothetical protein